MDDLDAFGTVNIPLDAAGGPEVDTPWPARRRPGQGRPAYAPDGERFAGVIGRGSA
jgi:hypothetical protein